MFKKLVVVLLTLFILSACELSEDDTMSLEGTWKAFNVNTPGGSLDITFAFSTGQLIAVTFTAGTLTNVGSHSGSITPSNIDDVNNGDIIIYTVGSSTGNAPNSGTIQKMRINNLTETKIVMDVDTDNSGVYDLINLECIKQ